MTAASDRVSRAEDALLDDGVMVERQYEVTDANDLFDTDPADTSVDVCRAPTKRSLPHDVSDHAPEENNKKRVRRKLLFVDDEEDDCREQQIRRDYRETELAELARRPTLHRFVYGDDVLDLRCPLPGYEGASVMLTNVFNTFVHIVQYKSTLQSMNKRKLAIQLRAVEHHLRDLEKNNYEGAHVQLPRMVESFFSMWDYRRDTIYINQLKPVSCALDKAYLKANISFRSMEAISRNESNYIELTFFNPFRFIFVGCSERGGMHNKNVVSPFPFFGEYIKNAVNDMADVMYELVTEAVGKAKKALDEADKSERGPTDLTAATTTPINSLQSLTSFGNSHVGTNNNNNNNNNNDAASKERLLNYLRTVQLPMVKLENVHVLTTSGNGSKNQTDGTKLSYLVVENEGDPKKGNLNVVDTDVPEDSVYLSSYIRCRVLLLQKATFKMQIYTRNAIKLLMIDDRLVRFSDFN